MFVEIPHCHINNEKDNIIKRTRKDISEMPMGDVLLNVFDQLTDPSTILVAKKVIRPPAIFNLYWDRLFADYKNSNLNLSLMLERTNDSAELAIYSKMAYWISKEDVLYPWEITRFKSHKGLGEDLISSFTGDLVFPSHATEAVLDICKSVSEAIAVRTSIGK
jgi:hypothetical protein